MVAEPGRVVGGRYVLEEPLGRGGMGSIWRGRQRELGLVVAIKFLDGALAGTEQGRKRFEREARSAALIQSPYVVKVFDHGVEDDVPFLVMELLEGEDMRTLLKRERTLPPDDVEAFVSQIAKGLKKAHEAGVVHRDLKPANIFVLREDDDALHIKILDFGIAKIDAPAGGETLTESGATIGSPHYMSPEQARGLSEIDHRSDLWSLGVVIFRALTGKPPFEGQAMGDVILKVCTAPIPLMKDVAPHLDAAWDGFFAKALARDPAERFQSAKELAAYVTSVVRPSGAPQLSDSSSVPMRKEAPLPRQPSRSEPPFAEPTTKIATTSDSSAKAARARWPYAVAAGAILGAAALTIGIASMGTAPSGAAGVATTASAAAVKAADAPSATAPSVAATDAVVVAPTASASAAASSSAPRASGGRARPGGPPAATPRGAPTFDFGL
jgi:serine/threonine-protein kinase